MRPHGTPERKGKSKTDLLERQGSKGVFLEDGKALNSVKCYNQKMIQKVFETNTFETLIN